MCLTYSTGGGGGGGGENLFINKLNVTYLNVCGLKFKLLNPDFVDLVIKHHILFCDELDVINLPGGYSYHCKNRKKCKKKSGGIIIIYKTSLSRYIIFF